MYFSYSPQSHTKATNSVRLSSKNESFIICSLLLCFLAQVRRASKKQNLIVDWRRESFKTIEYNGWELKWESRSQLWQWRMIRFKAEVEISRRASKQKQWQQMNGSRNNSGEFARIWLLILWNGASDVRVMCGGQWPLCGRDLCLGDDVTTGIPTWLSSWLGIPHPDTSARKDTFDQNWNMSPTQ